MTARRDGSEGCRSWMVSWLAILVGLTACHRTPKQEVVVYTSLDREFSEPIFAAFTERTGIHVRAKYDTEANKTIGLTQLLLRERQRPRCDLFWNNEIMNTVRLEQEGLLEPYATPVAERYPTNFRAANATWHGFAARARVLLVNTDLVAADQRPQSLQDLLDPRWQGRVGIAKPLFGTTATHAATLFQVWGPARAEEFLRSLRHSAQIFPGNRQVAHAVGVGQIAIGLTDTDDAIIELERGMPVAIVYPDQAAGESGTLFIPNTLALLRHSPHPENGRQLLDYLLSPDVERRLSEGPSAQIPLQQGIAGNGRIETPATIRAMVVDFDHVAEDWPRVGVWLREVFSGPVE